MKILSKITCVVLALGLTFALSSCSKDECKTCTDDNGSLDDIELCKDDYGSNLLFDAAIASQELAGFTCD